MYVNFVSLSYFMISIFIVCVININKTSTYKHKNKLFRFTLKTNHGFLNKVLSHKLLTANV